ncbi:MAG: glycosyltransferase [Alphaproteobacteria bacterium]|nr:glycosyltransferase [Alphaproteobacteria bacterium]
MSQTPSFQSNRNNHGGKPAALQSRTTILHLAGDLELGATSREIVDLAIQTHRSGWRPLVSSSGGALVLEAERSAIRHTRLPLKTKSIFKSWRNRVRLEKLIEKERPALLHVHGYDVIPLATKLSVKRNIPLLIDLTEPTPVTPHRRKALQVAATRGACFRVPSSFMAQHLRSDLKLETEHLYLVPPGIDLHWYDAGRVTPERINKLYQSWRLPEQSTVLVMATPLATGYGHSALLEALTAFTNTDIYAVLIGNDLSSPGMRAKVEKMVTDKGLEGRIIMPESCTDWPAACWLASIVTATNALPRGQAPELLAAQAIGRPVIVTACGANTELVKANETAWVIPPDDHLALVAALQEALSMSPSRRIDLAVQTREFVTESFPMEIWRDSLFGLYDSMLGPSSLSVAA